MKREWDWSVDTCGRGDTIDALWAIVERLEALVGVMDELEQVGDVIANHLSFGGQPVGEATHPANWQCQKIKECSLFNGHQGECIRPHDNAVTLKGCELIHQATGEKCALLAGHDGIHAFPEPGESDEIASDGKTRLMVEPIIPARICQCVTPVFMVGEDLCEKCGYPEDKNAP